MSGQTGDRLPGYIQGWNESLALLLSRLTSAGWQAQPQPQKTVSETGQPRFWLQSTVAGDIAGQQWLGLSAADAGRLLKLFLGEEVTLTDKLDDMQAEAIEELVRQWAGLAASALKAEFGELTLQIALDPAHVASGKSPGAMAVSDGSASVAVFLELSPELVSALAGQAAAATTDASPAAPLLTSPPVDTNSSARIEELLRQGNLELLMDVELAVMLRFGCRQTTLDEVLELASGAVLELDREIQQPVDLVLNGRVIARGEVVVVDGNYGLRVTEVATPQQRVNSL